MRALMEWQETSERGDIGIEGILRGGIGMVKTSVREDIDSKGTTCAVIFALKEQNCEGILDLKENTWIIDLTLKYGWVYWI